MFSADFTWVIVAFCVLMMLCYMCGTSVTSHQTETVDVEATRQEYMRRVLRDHQTSINELFPLPTGGEHAETLTGEAELTEPPPTYHIGIVPRDGHPVRDLPASL